MLSRQTSIGGLSYCSPVFALSGNEELQFHVLFITCVPAVRSLTCIVQYTIDTYSSYLIKTSSPGFYEVQSIEPYLHFYLWDSFYSNFDFTSECIYYIFACQYLKEVP